MPDPVDNNTANAAAEAEQPELRRRRDRRRSEDTDARTGTMPITPSDAVDNSTDNRTVRPLRRNSWAEAAEAADERNAATGAVPVIRNVPAAPVPPAAPPASAVQGPLPATDFDEQGFDEEAFEDFEAASPAFEAAAPVQVKPVRTGGNGLMLALGGLVLAGAGIDSTNQLVTYDDRPGTQTAAALPVKYDGGEALAVGNRIVFGGGALGGNPTATALLLEADGSASPTTMPASVIGATGASTERAAYFGGGFLAPTFVTMTELFVYTNPDVLTVDVADIPLSLGGVANFDFHAGAGEAGKSFVLLYSASGTAPGFLFDGQLIPLNFDALVIKSISLPGAPPLYDAAGVLGADGHAEPRFDIPPGLNPGLAGISLSFCAVSYDLFAIPLVSMVSNPQSFVFTP